MTSFSCQVQGSSLVERNNVQTLQNNCCQMNQKWLTRLLWAVWRAGKGTIDSIKHVDSKDNYSNYTIKLHIVPCIPSTHVFFAILVILLFLMPNSTMSCLLYSNYRTIHNFKPPFWQPTRNFSHATYAFLVFQWVTPKGNTYFKSKHVTNYSNYTNKLHIVHTFHACLFQEQTCN